MTILPAIRIVATGEIRIGRRGEPHNWLTTGQPDRINPGTWVRGWWDCATKSWRDIDDVPGGCHGGETETARVCRELRNDR